MRVAAVGDQGIPVVRSCGNAGGAQVRPGLEVMQIT